MKQYEVKSSILGFETIQTLEIHEIDELFCTMKDANNNQIAFTIVNPYVLREYSFDLPTNIKILLDINEKSQIKVFNIVVIQNPLENSTVNFLAPIIVNEDNNTIAQAILNKQTHPDFGMAEMIKSFKEN